MRGLENPIRKAEVVFETRNEAGRLVIDTGIEVERVTALWDSFGDDYFLRHSADEIRWHTMNILLAGAADDPPGPDPRRTRGHRDLRLCAGPGVPLRGQCIDPGASGAHGARFENHHRKSRHDPRFVHRRGHRGFVRQGEPPQEIRNALQSGLRSPAAFRGTWRRLAKRQLKHFTIPMEVSFTHDASSRCTVMEVIAADRPGLLARIGWALADARVRIRNAKIATFGERAEDVFYVTDAPQPAAVRRPARGGVPRRPRGARGLSPKRSMSAASG